MKMLYVINFLATLAVVCSTGKYQEIHIEKYITFSQSVNNGTGIETLPFKTFLNKQLNKQNYVLKIKGEATIIVKVPKWKPKITYYNPKKVDWNSVISGCRATCRFDKRLCNFYIRAAAHDSLSISEGYGGADGSMILTQDELSRPENNYDSFAFLLSKNVLALAQKYDSSVADILAVCGAVATEFHGGPTIVKYDKDQPFLVGRLDNIIPNPGKSLAAANLNTKGFSNFAKGRNLTHEEMTALMGSHSLLDTTGCLKTNGQMCDPNKESCKDLTMYRWSNKYYNDVCTPTIRVNVPRVKSTLPLQTVEFTRLQEMCKFTSKKLRDRAVGIFDAEIIPVVGITVIDPKAFITDLGLETEDVTWYNKNMISMKWNYTINDAYLGLACQRKLENTNYNKEIGDSMNLFKTSSSAWDKVYIRAYKKMINTGVNWAVPNGFAITGDECKSNNGYISGSPRISCSLCTEIARRGNNYNCPSVCKCNTALNNNVEFYDVVMN
jgi:hypothetical protein